MITLITVVPNIPEYNYDAYAQVMIDSLLRRTRQVSRVIIANTQEVEDASWVKILKTYEVRGVHFTELFVPVLSYAQSHALGLHTALNHVRTEYVMFCDPDVFFCTAAEEVYLDAMTRHNLTYVGCSHHAAVSNAYGFVPYLVNSLVRVKDLPPPNYLKGQLRLTGILTMEKYYEEIDNLAAEPEISADGMWLVPGPIPHLHHVLPNVKPEALYDTGVNLCLYALENNWRWLSYQTIDTRNYTTKYRRGNFKTNDKQVSQKLIYHAVRSGVTEFSEAYKQS
jgi:hypothetical protein